MRAPGGFAYRETKDGAVLISHHHRGVTTLRGRAAEQFLRRARAADDEGLQHLLARATGHYKHGNERR